MINKGFLAIWCDIDKEDLSDYRNWITQEHIADRISLPGWEAARLCINPENECSHFFLYATEAESVFSEDPYLQVLDNTSPWTNRIMPKFGEFDRALGQQLFKIGNGVGAYLLVCKIKHASLDSIADVEASLKVLMEIHDVVGVRLMKLDRSRTDIDSVEKTMREGKEGDFHYLLVVEALSESAANGAKTQADSLLLDVFSGAENINSSVRQVIYSESKIEAAAGYDVG